MINKKLIAYDFNELEKKCILSDAKTLFKSNVISDEQHHKINEQFKSKLYTPNVFVRALLFILTYIGILTLMGPISLIFGEGIDETGMRIMAVLLGLAVLLILDVNLVRKNHHYKSGVTEATLLTGLLLLGFGLLGFSNHAELTYLFLGLVFSFYAAVRYLNLIALIAVLCFTGAIVFQLLISTGGWAKAVIPFAVMALYSLLFWLGVKLEKRLSSFVFNDHFIILKVFCLLMIYLGGNYFVVRELSAELMGVWVEPGTDIPFAFLFYFFTAFIPIGYVVYGIKKKSILFVRVALLTIVLSIVTLKIYFSLGAPIVTITLSGAVMIGLSLLLFRYLKKPKKGYTREKLLDDKWDSSDLTAFVISQSLSGHKIASSDDKLEYGGGEFGGGGAGGEF